MTLRLTDHDGAFAELAELERAMTPAERKAHLEPLFARWGPGFAEEYRLFLQRAPQEG